MRRAGLRPRKSSWRMSRQESRQSEYALAVDLGGTWLRAGLVTAAGEILSQRRIATPAAGRPEPVLQAIISLVAQVRVDCSPDDVVAGLGVAVPGPLDPATGMVYAPPNLADWGAFPLADRLQAALDMPVRLHNDANLAALGEAQHGAGKDARVLTYYTVSTGIGGGIILDGRIFEGAAGLAGELGHVIVDADSPWLCRAGHRGCLEALSSGTAIARQATALGPAADGAVGWTAATVAGRALAGEAWASQLFTDAGRHLGLALGGLVNILDPGRIVLGGGLTGSWELWMPALRVAMAEVVMVPDRRVVEVVRAALGDDAGLLGAAAYAFATLAPTGPARSPVVGR